MAKLILLKDEFEAVRALAAREKTTETEIIRRAVLAEAARAGLWPQRSGVEREQAAPAQEVAHAS